MEKTKRVPGSIPQGKLHTFLPCRKVDWVGEHSRAQGPFSIWMWRVERQHTCASLEPVRPEKSAQAMGTAGKSTDVLRFPQGEPNSAGQPCLANQVGVMCARSPAVTQDKGRSRSWRMAEYYRELSKMVLDLQQGTQHRSFEETAR